MVIPRPTQLQHLLLSYLFLLRTTCSRKWVQHRDSAAVALAHVRLGLDSTSAVCFSPIASERREGLTRGGAVEEEMLLNGWLLGTSERDTLTC